MSMFQPVPGNEFLLHGKWHRVHSYNRENGYIVAVDGNGTLSTLTLDEVIHHPALATPHERPAIIDMAGFVSEHDRRLAMLRIDEVQEAVTGYRSGDPQNARPGEPRPQYDPQTTTKGARLEAKAAELDTPANNELGLKMSVRTMRRIDTALRDGDAISHSLGKHKPRHSSGRRAMSAEFEQATRYVVESRKRGSTTTLRTLWVETQGHLKSTKTEKWFADCKKPSYSTWWRWVHDHYTPSQLTGRASTRATATDAPKGGFVRTNLTRPGQLVLMDTNSLDVLLKGTGLEGVVRGSLIAAIDGYSWSCAALRVVEQSETAFDVTMTFLDIGRPKQMDPSWGNEYRWPFVGMPQHLLATIGGYTEIAGMPVINVEALGLDHGSTYKSRKTRQLAKKYKVDLLPARVRTGADKAPVERFFGAMRTMLLEKLQGYRGSNPAERGEDVDGEVEWTAQRLEDLITEWVILGWQTHIMDNHKPAWCPEGDWSPNDLYQHGITTGGFMPSILTCEDYFSALRTTQVKVHSRGVNVNGLWYDDSLLDEWRCKPAPTGSKKWSVQADERDLRYVHWIDGDGQRHRLEWTGCRGDLPAFSKRHVNALRRRVGDLKRYDSDELALILLTKILPVPGPSGQWTADDRKANAEASRHNRDLELVERDEAKAGLRTAEETPAQDAATEPAKTPSAARRPAATEAARRAQRTKATANDDVEPAPQLGARRSSLLNGYQPTETDGAA